ncbi:MAG: hypothetical protein AAF456_24195 [Planctomycetota bacterium]
MDDYFDESDDWYDESLMIECPGCGESIYHDSEQCPNCYEYILDNSINRSSSIAKIIVWLLIIALVFPGLIAVLTMI